jgi:hypothetical protein
MERLVNSNIIISIDLITSVSGGNQMFEIIFYTKDKEKFKLTFDGVWDLRCAIENAFLDRGSKFVHNESQKSSVLMIENSKYIEYFEKQVSGTRPVNGLKNYIVFDAVDTIIEIITTQEATISKI